MGSLLPHERTDRRLALDLTERRLAALVPVPAPRARRGGESQSGNGPEIAGRTGPVGAEGVTRFSTFDGPKSQRRLRRPPSPFAFFFGGGDMHGSAPRSSASS